ncbi:MAG: SH3 domain-containing protein [Anaerolineales bacterium]|nr:SH3 domain-containing protein [Anaerolineales bacterium]
MNIWRQLPWLTKVYMVIIAMLVGLLMVLVLARADVPPFGQLQAMAISTRERDSNAPETSLTPAAAAPAIQAGTPAIVASSQAEIRSGPSSDSPSVGSLQAGQRAEIVGITVDNQWWAIKLPGAPDRRGWVFTDQVEVDNPQGLSIPAVQIDLSPQRTVTPQRAVVVAIANVFIRDGPGTFFNQIGLLPNGQAADVLGVSRDYYWWAIEIPGTDRQGWVAADYVVARNAESVSVVDPQEVNSAPEVPTPAIGAPRVTALATVNIREGPGTVHAVIGKLQQDQRAEVVGRSADGEWWAIKLAETSGGVGWVDARFVRAENVENVPVIE